MFFVALNKKGEYANYWGTQPQDVILSGKSTSLDGILSFNRSKLPRRCLSFNATSSTLGKIAAAGVRPLLNLLKTADDNYIVVGRNVALVEESVGCRSRQGRHMIVYNLSKPTVKFYFRLYMMCCSSTWISLSFRLHTEEAQRLSDKLTAVLKIRQHVLEVVRPGLGTNRIVNMDCICASASSTTFERVVRTRHDTQQQQALSRTQHAEQGRQLCAR